MARQHRRNDQAAHSSTLRGIMGDENHRHTWRGSGGASSKPLDTDHTPHSTLTLTLTLFIAPFTTHQKREELSLPPPSLPPSPTAPRMRSFSLVRSRGPNVLSFVRQASPPPPPASSLGHSTAHCQLVHKHVLTGAHPTWIFLGPKTARPRAMPMRTA
jgi:hypothetical protein